jgi:predicted permease
MNLPVSALDIRYVLRGLTRSPLFAAVTIVTLGLAIGANAAVFSLVDQALLRPLPYPDAERLVAVWADWSPRGAQQAEFTNPEDFYDWREQSETIADMAAYAGARPAFTAAGEPRLLLGGAVTQSFFEVLGVRFPAGRGFVPQEDLPNGPDVAVISHALWQEEFAGSATVLERAITLDGRPHGIVGVLPAGFSFPFLPGRDVWQPLQAERDGRGNAHLRVIGRLDADVSLESAGAEMSAITARLAREFPDTNEGIGAYVQPLQDAVVAGVQQRLLVLWAAVGFVLLIAVVNIANLLLVRSIGRTREFAVRGALGAQRTRLMSLVIVESLLLSAGGASLGLAVAVSAVRVLRRQLPDGVADIVVASIDLRVFAISVLASFVSGLVFGLLPAVRAGRIDAGSTLNSGDRVGDAPLTSRLRSAFVVANLALALVLTLGAGVFIKSLLRLEAVDPGFSAGGVLTATIDFPTASYAGNDDLRSVQDAIHEKLNALPGVVAAGFTSTLPMADFETDASVVIEGRPTQRRDGRAHVWFSIVSPGYLDAMRIRPLQGRLFSLQDRNNPAGNVVVNDAFVREYLADAEPVGLRVSARSGADNDWMPITGVVDDIRFFGMDQAQTPAIYLPSHRFPRRDVFVTLRTGGDPQLLAGPLREAVATLDPTLAVDDVQPMSARVEESLRPARSTAALIGTFAAAALLIAVIGVYGSISYSATQRKREFGVRMALGASGSAVLQLVLRQGMLLAFAGVSVGLALAAGLSKGVGAMLFEVQPMDPAVVVAVAGLLVIVALAATLIPAWRAARIEPMRVLREE